MTFFYSIIITHFYTKSANLPNLPNLQDPKRPPPLSPTPLIAMRQGQCVTRVKADAKLPSDCVTRRGRCNGFGCRCRRCFVFAPSTHHYDHYHYCQNNHNDHQEAAHLVPRLFLIFVCRHQLLHPRLYPILCNSHIGPTVVTSHRTVGMSQRTVGMAFKYI